MKIGIFGGSFDPVHTQHVALVEAVQKHLGLDRVLIVSSYLAPHKRGGAFASGEDRLKMCKIAFSRTAGAVISGFELNAGGTSYSYLTCRRFRAQYPKDELFFIVGADMLENFPHWKNPAEILSLVRLAAVSRGERRAEDFASEIERRFGAEVTLVPFTGSEVSSSRFRSELAFGRECELDPDVRAYIDEKGLYTHPAIAPALALEKEPRREHSFRVALLASEVAKKEGISEWRAILASALHDCGKYVDLSSPLLNGFVLPEGIPEPVAHQFTGAYVAEKLGVEDREVLSAIACHTSGKAGMSPLEKLIFTADMLEEGRSFEGVGGLREALSRSLDEGFYACLEAQYEHLASSGKPVCSLTAEAYRYEKARKNEGKNRN